LALGATLGVATGVIPVPHLGGRGQAESSLYPSPPAPSVPAGFHLVAADPLAAPRSGWQPVSDPKHKATCEVGTGLEVTLAVRGPYRCPGPDALAERLDGNVAVFVTVELRTPGSCAGIWFHFYNLSGYLLQVCQDGMHLLIHGRPTDVDVERLDDFGPGLPVGQASRIGVTMHGDQLRFYRDGRMVRDYTASTEYVPPGHVVLGAYIGGTPGKPPYRVRFTDVEIWSDNT
ncbi:MAG TPA: hypothetical protein VJT31_04190, partial [Rugosimonospora sp.]|nr:hypothetical protein [Rugosimonospora sp.]